MYYDPQEKNGGGFGDEEDGQERRERERSEIAGISHFYFNPSLDTLFLNCVASIFLDVRWFLLDETPPSKSCAPMCGWKNVALDSLHMRFVAVVASSDLPTPQKRIAKLWPDLENLYVAVDSEGSARRRLRASLRPGAKTKLLDCLWDEVEGADEIEGFFEKDYGEDEVRGDVRGKGEGGRERQRIPELKMCRVRRDRFLVGVRQDLVYGYVGGCQILKGIKRRVFRR